MSDGDESLIDDLMRLVPGYGAYRDQESRRADDRLTRAFLAGRLNDCKAKLDELGRGRVATGDIDGSAQLEGIRSKVDLARGRVAAALEGYAGWFSERKVDAELLARIAEMDHSLVSSVDMLDSELGAGLSGGELDVGALEDQVARIHERIDRRNEFLNNG